MMTKHFFNRALLTILLLGLLPGCTSESPNIVAKLFPTTRSAAALEQPDNASAHAPSFDKWTLWNGETQLRGANIYQRRVYPELDGATFMGAGPAGPPYTQQDFDNLAALGANYVNISHPGLYSESPPYVLDSGIQANLDNLLQMIAQADMFAVISFRTGPGRSEFTFFWDEAGSWFDASYLNDNVWADQAAQDAWVAMWQYTAERYQDNPIVVGYDLMVEPNSNEVGSDPLQNPLNIWDPDEFYNLYGGTLYDWNQLHPRITNGIRSVDSHTPILIGGMAYGEAGWLPYMVPTGDSRTVYTVHQYAPSKYTHQWWDDIQCPAYPGWCDVDWDGTGEWFDQTWSANLLASTVDVFVAEHGAPVAVNEFGLVRWAPDAAAFMTDEINLFEQRGLNHALWVWEPTWLEWAEVVDSFNFRHGSNPQNHAEVPGNALEDAIVAAWGRNEIRPSSAITANNPDFPRLGMWWPDPWEQPLTDIARYDWVILGPWAEEFVTPLKAIKPDITLLSSTNACELAYDPAPGADPADNAEVLAIPPEWFLTQVGTTLTQAADATTTVLHVAEMSVTDGAEVFPLFVVDDTVLIEGESVFVEAVDVAAKTLTVQRGYVRPAAAHTAGTRIAAHITFWPDSWLLNLSTMSPTAVISATYGMERWGDYNARVATELLSNPDWDGILIDRADPDQSWLVGGSTARTIDPDQSNTLITDYSAFDAAWNDGLRDYEDQLRQAVGEDEIIFANWGMDNYDLLNGNNYEGFPLDNGRSYRGSWHETMFGSISNVGSYLNWMEQGQQPNLTMIETYEDDSAPSATGDGSYDNPCDDVGFVPNYQKMRFGLTTALLNDGYYSYEISTNGHGSLCLLWFDEYDNAGQGRGYLGQPLGPAYRVGDVLLGDNLLSGADFETQNDLDQWSFWADTGYAGTVVRDTATAVSGNASARIDITQAQGVDWQASFSFTPTEVISGTEYTLSFWAKADQPRLITGWSQQNQAPWDSYFEFDDFPLTTSWQHYEVIATATGNDPQAIFQLGMGQVTGSVWLDDVRLQVGNQDVWRRDYVGGVALVNATNSPHTVELGGSFQKINGGQAPLVNDGSFVTQVSLPALDGLVLLRPLGSNLYLPIITIAAANQTDILLSWPHDAAYTGYQVWRDTVPYFQLTGAVYGEVTAVPWEFPDAAVRENANNSYYYLVQGFLNNGATLSRRVGVFNFDLMPGEL